MVTGGVAPRSPVVVANTSKCEQSYREIEARLDLIYTHVIGIEKQLHQINSFLIALQADKGK